MHFCGAVIIHPRVILSSAVCFQRYKLPYIRAVAGLRNLQSSEDGRAQVRDVEEIVVHEGFTFTQDGNLVVDNDIALLLLNGSLHFDRHVNKVEPWPASWELPGEMQIYRLRTRYSVSFIDKRFLMCHKQNLLTSSAGN